MIPILSAIIPLVSSVIDKAVPDKNAAEKAKNELTSTLIDNSAKIEQAAAQIVEAEAKSDHWLAANWRPITALTFLCLLVAHWFGWSASNLTEAEYLSIYDLMKIMIGGYVVSRGAEKGVKVWKEKG